MLNIPVSVQNLFKQDGIPKQFRVHFPNGERADIEHDQIVEGSVKFTESVSSKDVLQFGLAEASEIQFECVGVENIYGVTIQCATEILVGDADGEDIDNTLSWLTPQYVERSGKKYYRVPYGEFRVEKCPRQAGAMKHRRVQGYGRTALDDIDLSDLLNRETIFSSYIISDAWLSCVVNPSNYEEGETYESDLRTISGYFHNSNGKAIKLTFRHRTENCIHSSSVMSSSSSNVNADALLFRAEYDSEKYADIGAQLITFVGSKNIDLCYNNKKQKVYSDNEDAIRSVMPYLFEPSIIYGNILNPSSDDWFEISSGYAVNIDGYTITPSSKSEGIKGVLSNYECSPRLVYLTRGASCIFEIEIYANDIQLFDGNSEENYVTSVTSDYSITINERTWLFTPATNTLTLSIRPTLKIAKAYNSTVYYSYATGKYATKNVSLTGYTYANAFSVQKTILGLYELNAQFGRFNRQNEVVGTSLSKSNPITLTANNYSDLWWDEYDISPIGSVAYAFGQDNQIAIYTFGEGSSVYDMTDNYLLERIASDNAENAIATINNLLDTYFIPNIQDISFTPVDLEMIGLPYVEAGDYIVIDNGDGGTVGTYVLERSISGEMYLDDDISSEGGEIISSTERSI